MTGEDWLVLWWWCCEGSESISWCLCSAVSGLVSSWTRRHRLSRTVPYKHDCVLGIFYVPTIDV